MVLNILRTDMDISIKISLSQTIIGNKKIATYPKKHSSSHWRSGKQTITTKTIYSLLLFTLFSNYLDTLEMFQCLNIHQYRRYRHPTET